MKIVLIGAGNVATHLGVALKKAKHEILQVYSRSESSSRELSQKLRCKYTTDVKSIFAAADLYIISISDHAIKEFLKYLSLKNKIIVHTSGSVPMKIFGKKFTNHGVIYPLQSFSKERNIRFNEVPLLVEGNNAATFSAIASLARSVSPFVFEMSSADRKTVHLAAVIANNFSNHLFVQAEKILMKKNIPFPLLGPLMHETVIKAIKVTPKAAQTGPAKRGDAKIIEEHLAMLKNEPSLQKIYKLLSESIEQESGQRL
ncbi:MAG: DUF2520 domain-containing protein [Bacteroidetes bacterium]|nr:DUF2520 domain-containing protein [Bacteroidota bacterium]